MRISKGMRRFCEEKRLGKTDALAFSVFIVCAIQGYTFFLECRSLRVGVFALLALILVAGLWMWHRILPMTVERLTQRVFPVVLVILSVSFALFFPPGSSPDESYHYRTAYMYSNVITGQDIDSMRSDDAELLTEKTAFAKSVSTEHWKAAEEEFGLAADDTSIEHEYWLTHSENYDGDTIGSLTSLPLIQLKIAPAVGIALGRFLGIGAIPLFYLGRLFNLALGTLLIILAVRFTPIGKNIFMTIALLPMTLHLLGSYSYDSPIIGMAFLLTALLFRAIRGEGRISRGLWISILFIDLVLAPCKVVYLTINFLVLFIPAQRFASKRNAIIFKACAIVLPIVVIGIARFATFEGMTEQEALSGNEAQEGNYYTFSQLLAHPLSTFLLFFDSLYIEADTWLLQMVGCYLGWLEQRIQAPEITMYLLVLLVIISSIRSKEDDIVLPLNQRFAFMLVFAVAFLGVMLSLATGWTGGTSNYIEGVQGRYATPVIIIALLALRPKCVQITANTGFPLVMTLAGFNCIYLSYIAFRVFTS